MWHFFKNKKNLLKSEVLFLKKKRSGGEGRRRKEEKKEKKKNSIWFFIVPDNGSLWEIQSTLQLETRFLSSQKVQLSTSPCSHKLTPGFLWVKQRLGRTHPAHSAPVLGRYGVSVHGSTAVGAMGPHYKSASAKLDNGWSKIGLLLCFTTIGFDPHLAGVPSQSHCFLFWFLDDFCPWLLVLWCTPCR